MGRGGPAPCIVPGLLGGRRGAFRAAAATQWAGVSASRGPPAPRVGGLARLPPSFPPGPPLPYRAGLRAAWRAWAGGLAGGAAASPSSPPPPPSPPHWRRKRVWMQEEAASPAGPPSRWPEGASPGGQRRPGSSAQPAGDRGRGSAGFPPGAAEAAAGSDARGSRRLPAFSRAQPGGGTTRAKGRLQLAVGFGPICTLGWPARPPNHARPTRCGLRAAWRL